MIQKIKAWIKGYPGLSLTLISLLLVITIYHCFRIIQLERKLSRYQPKISAVKSLVVKNENGETDLVHVNFSPNTFTPLPEYPNQQVPNMILYWGLKDNAALDSLSQIRILETYTVGNRDTSSSRLDSSSRSLPFTPIYGISRDSLVQLLLDRKSLELDFENSLHQVYSIKYNIDPNRYKYNWTPLKGLTYQYNPSLEIQPYLYGSYQFFNKDLRMGSGISFKTRKIDYNLGVSLSHNSNLYAGLKPDVEVFVIYKFKSWLK